MTHQQSPAPATADPRPAGLRALLWFGILFSGLVGILLTALGLAGLGVAAGQASLCFGLVLLLVTAGGLAREKVERSVLRNPPAPRLTTLAGEQALMLPRHRGRSLVAAWILAGLAAIGALGAAFAVGAGQPIGAVVLAVVAAALLVAGAPWRVPEDGVWCTPTRLVHEHDNARWELPWDDATGSWAADPVPVMVRPGHLPRVRRGVSSLRLRYRLLRDDTLWIEAHYLAGGPPLLSYVVLHAIGDRSFRAALGTPESLPPADPAAR